MIIMIVNIRTTLKLHNKFHLWTQSKWELNGYINRGLGFSDSKCVYHSLFEWFYFSSIHIRIIQSLWIIFGFKLTKYHNKPNPCCNLLCCSRKLLNWSLINIATKLYTALVNLHFSQIAIMIDFLLYIGIAYS